MRTPLAAERRIDGRPKITMFQRGSRKHVLDWTSRPEFLVDLLRLLEPVDVRITARSHWMPRGYASPEEARLDSFGPKCLPDLGAVWHDIRAWWLRHEAGANTPNWDIALACEIEGRPGVVLVEAKANVPELGPAGKRREEGASPRSAANHEQIGQAIAEACRELRRIEPAVAISRDRHYQLSNRLAFAWKLASLGVPTVLVYLGFIGDDGITDVGAPFEDSSHWQEEFNRHAAPVAPKALFNRRINCDTAPAWFLVRDRPVIEASSARPPDDAPEPAARTE